jgi:hypothetical protein
VLLVGGSRSSDPYASVSPADSLTADQASALLVDAARGIVGAASLDGPSGGVALRSCTNAQDPPYQAVVHMTFILPQGNSVGYLNHVAADLIADGWSETGVAAEHFGHKLSRDGIVSVFYRNTERTDMATMRLFGPCAVHRRGTAAWTEITERLQRGG